MMQMNNVLAFVSVLSKLRYATCFCFIGFSLWQLSRYWTLNKIGAATKILNPEFLSFLWLLLFHMGSLHTDDCEASAMWIWIFLINDVDRFFNLNSMGCWKFLNYLVWHVEGCQMYSCFPCDLFSIRILYFVYPDWSKVHECFFCRFWLLLTPQTPTRWFWRNSHRPFPRKTFLVWRDWITTGLWARFQRDWMFKLVMLRMSSSGEITHQLSILMSIMQLSKRQLGKSPSVSLWLMMIGIKTNASQYLILSSILIFWFKKIW